MRKKTLFFGTTCIILLLGISWYISQKGIFRQERQSYLQVMNSTQALADEVRESIKEVKETVLGITNSTQALADEVRESTKEVKETVLGITNSTQALVDESRESTKEVKDTALGITNSIQALVDESRESIKEAVLYTKNSIQVLINEARQSTQNTPKVIDASHTFLTILSYATITITTAIIAITAVWIYKKLRP